MSLINALKMQLGHLLYFNELKMSAKDPRKTQEQLLFKILKKNASTMFGQKYQFCTIHTYVDFKN